MPAWAAIDRQPVDAASEVETTCRFRARTRDLNEARLRALLLQSIGGHGYMLRALESADVEATDQVELKRRWRRSRARRPANRGRPPAVWASSPA